jgi:2'-5' RNA ligase
MRSFIAIEVPDEVKAVLVETQQRLRQSGVEASWPRPEAMHLTLKFLGEVAEEQVQPILAALLQAAQGSGPLTLQAVGVGTFPNARNARVVWVGLSGDVEALNRLQAAIEDSLVRLGMARDDRTFTPHLTLGRIKAIRSRDRWVQALDEHKTLALPPFTVTAVHLMKSELKRTGAEYTELGRVELK